MNTMKKTAAGAVLGGALLAAGGFGLAHAAPEAAAPVVNDGKVNVTVTSDGQEVGILQGVTLAKAQSLTASACANSGINTEALKALDTDGTPVPGTCASLDGRLSFAFAQNTPDSSGQSGTTSSSSTSTTPTTTTSSR